MAGIFSIIVSRWTAERDKTEGTEKKEERWEEELLAPDAWRDSATF